ncbi:MAG: type II secretion system protein [Actinomycetota bacterium]
MFKRTHQQTDTTAMRTTPDAAPPEQGPDSRRDAGFTLAENLIAMALMSTIVLTLILGTWVVIRTSKQNDELAKIEAVLGSAADRIANYRYIPCPENVTAGGYEEIGSAATAGVGWAPETVSISRYEYWDVDADAWTDSNAIDASGDCNTQVGLTTAATLQKVTVTVTTPDGGKSRSMEVVKADIRPTEVKDETQVP